MVDLEISRPHRPIESLNVFSGKQLSQDEGQNKSSGLHEASAAKKRQFGRTPGGRIPGSRLSSSGPMGANGESRNIGHSFQQA